MNNIKKVIDKYELYSRNYTYMNNARIIETEAGKFVLKKKKRDDKSDIYNYLNTRGFSYFLPMENDGEDDYELYPYLEEVNIPREQKATDLVYLMSILHNKTTYYREVSLDHVKQLYEELLEKINYLSIYYHELQDIIEQKIYFSPSEYLLMRNISTVYEALDYARNTLEEWYSKITEQKKERIVLLHNNLSTSHILATEKEEKIISWDHAEYNLPIYDFIKFYKDSYMDFPMDTLFKLYQSRFQYTEEEWLLFSVLIVIPDKISISREHYKNTYEIMRFTKYNEITKEFILKENQKKKKGDQQEFDE